MDKDRENLINETIDYIRDFNKKNPNKTFAVAGHVVTTIDIINGLKELLLEDEKSG